MNCPQKTPLAPVEVILDPTTVARELAEALIEATTDPETPLGVIVRAKARLEILADRCRGPVTIPLGLSMLRKIEALEVEMVQRAFAESDEPALRQI